MKRAIISVSNKKNIVPLAKFLIEHDFIIYSTGGTYKLIEENLENTDNLLRISELTQFPEILNGRVKTLHPHVYAGLLADKGNKDHTETMENMELPYFDLVVCNLYPFERQNTIENIDIGGVSLIRASGKNYNNIVLLTNQNQYTEFMENFDSTNAENMGICEDLRKSYASEGFKMTSNYDNLIQQFFSKTTVQLKYGMNPHQDKTSVLFNDTPFTVINGILGMINVIDFIHGWLTVKEVDDLLNLPAAISMKHTSLAGLAVGKNISRNTLNYFNIDGSGLSDGSEFSELSDVSIAYMKSRTCDPLSSFGDFICVSRTIDAQTALLIKKEVCDGIAAPDFTQEALEILKTKKNGRFIIIQMNNEYYNMLLHSGWDESKELYGVKLSQRNNTYRNSFDDIYDEQARIDHVLANSALKYAQSNNISMAVDGQVIGMGCGQQNRVGCVKLAGEKANNWVLRQSQNAYEFWKSDHGSLKRQEKVNLLYDYLSKNNSNITVNNYNIVMASDGFFPFTDNIGVANTYGVKHVIHPGGSLADEDIQKSCDSYNMSMYITNSRMFYH